MSSITQAASVLLAAGPGSPDVLVVRRAAGLRFFGGFLAFPGGKVAPLDVRDEAARADPDAATVVRRITAARELFEETGILLARRPDGSFPPSGPELARLRQELLAERLSFLEVLSRLNLVLQDTDLVPVGAVTTPPFAPLRFDTLFFLGHLPPGQQVDLWPGELDQAFWTSAAAVLGRWERGDCLVSPPTVVILEAIRDRPADEAPARLGSLFRALAAGAVHPIFFAPDVRMIPLFTHGLPPSACTNAYLVGRGPVYLLDPGAVAAEEQQRLFAVLDARQATSGRLTAVVLSHQHSDHIGAAVPCAERYGVPVWAHPLTARALAGRIPVARHLHDGERLPLGTAADGTAWHLEVVHTPGHAAGHLAFYEAHYALLFTGDMVSTLSSVIIAPPDGDLAVYLDSLRRLRAYPSRLLLPGHGNVSADPVRTIDECLAHRAKREGMLRATLGTTPRTVAELAPELYKGLPADMMRFAECQILAGLHKLRREGRVEEVSAGTEEGWRLRQAD